MRDINLVSGDVIDAAIGIHRELGPGMLEKVYETVLVRAMIRRRYTVEQQKPISFEYDGLVFENVCRADLIVDGRLVVEVKSVETLPPVCYKQLLTYLRLLDMRLGLLLNFGAPLMKDGIIRVING